MRYRVAKKILRQKTEDDCNGHPKWFRYSRWQVGAALRRSRKRRRLR
tara:strand:+ start:6307 stop:6447 length:141 start_codon:yes stop_codon:yes gene_type:complete